MPRRASIASWTFVVSCLVACGDSQDSPPTGVGGANQRASSNAEPRAARVVINGRELSADDRAAFKQLYRVEPAAGEYWYDTASGLWGLAGQGSAGFLLAGHDLGQLAIDASRGDTDVYLNSRRLPLAEVALFANIVGTPVLPGRYWLDGQGNFGYEGNPMAAGNLYMIAMQRSSAAYGGGVGGGAGGGGDNFWNTRFSAGNYNADNSAGYVSVPGVGPVSYGL
ncbi:MAG: hypothetical protein IT454_20990 [Planctomycetes bacterium]|nr:hypothetical protein [Planctomycetota bacterium]